MTLVYGFHPVKHLLATNPTVIKRLYIAKAQFDQRWQTLIQYAEKQRVPIDYVAKQQLEQQFQVAHHQGIVAVCQAMAEYTESNLSDLLSACQQPLLLVLDGIQDPHNLGACLRTANAAGVNIVIAPKNRAVGITPVVRKVAAGAAETTPFIQVTNLARTLRSLRERGIWLVGTSDQAIQSIYQATLTGPIALIMGAEGKGMRELTQKQCDQVVRIPMQGTVSSLNVSVATGICLFEIRRQRLI